MLRLLSHRTLHAFALVALATLMASCGEATSILVRVSSSTLTAPGDVDTLEFVVRGETTGHVETRRYPLTTSWPHSVSLRPGATEASRVSVTVRGLRGGTLVAEAMRSESFVRGTDIILDIELGAGPPPDAGPGDGGMADAAPSDAGPADDASAMDGGPDAAIADAGVDASRDAFVRDTSLTDAGCLGAGDCDDGIACTMDDCAGGACTHTPDDSGCADGTTCSLTAGCPPRSCTAAAECDDGRFCNGAEGCDGTSMTCTPGTDPCDDADDCTDDACDEAADTCRHTTRDFDRDGAGDATCTAVGGVPANDCDDHNTSVAPGVPDVCDGLDNDCSGTCDSSSTCCRGATDACMTMCGTTGTRTCGIACGWSVCSPPAESCNGMDDDCNGACDDGFACCAGSMGSCTTSCGSTGSRSCGADCTFGACTPPAETCNGRDDDCDTVCDDGFGCCAGVPSPCTTVCGSTGTRSCSATCVPGAVCNAPAETCNDADDDCDSRIDETFTCRNGSFDTCITTCGSTGTRMCSSCEWGTCTAPLETCFNMVDDDCDMMVDEGCPTCAACTGATPVTAPGGRFNVTTSASSNSGSCGGTGAEATLSFDLASASDVFITTHQSLRDTVVYVRRCACSGTEVGCNDNANGVASSALTLSALAPGRYNVFVDTNVAMSQSITVDVFINPAGSPYDRCGAPFAIEPGTTSVTGNSCGFANDYSAQLVAGATNCPSMGAGAANEAVTYFVVPTARTVTVSGCAATMYDQVLYLRSVCTDASLGAQTACSDDNCGAVSGMCDTTAASSLSVSLSPGIYYLFVDGFGTSGCNCGAFTLNTTGI